MLTTLSEDLAITLLRTALAPMQHQASSLRHPFRTKLPPQLFCLPPALHPLVLRAWAPCIEADRTYSLDIASTRGGAMTMHPAAPALSHFTALQRLTVVYNDLHETAFTQDQSALCAVARSVGTLPHLASLDVVAGQSMGFSQALAQSLPEASALTSLMLAHVPADGWHGVAESSAHFTPVLRQLPQLRRLMLRNTHLPQLGQMLSALRALRVLHIASTPMPASEAADLLRQAAALPALATVRLEHSVTFVAVHLPGHAGRAADASSDEDPVRDSRDGTCALETARASQGARGDADIGSRHTSEGATGSPPRVEICLSSAGLPRALGGVSQLRQISFIHAPTALHGAQVPARFLPRLCACMAACASLTALELADTPSVAYAPAAAFFSSARDDAVAIGGLLPQLSALQSLRLVGMRMDPEGSPLTQCMCLQTPWLL